MVDGEMLEMKPGKGHFPIALPGTRIPKGEATDPFIPDFDICLWELQSEFSE